MRLTILEAMEVGLFAIPFHPLDNPFLFGIFWLCFFIGVIIQIVLLQHCKGYGKWGFLFFSFFGLIVCEIACQVITGWDLLAWLLFWFLFLVFLLSAGLTYLSSFLLKKQK